MRIIVTHHDFLCQSVIPIADDIFKYFAAMSAKFQANVFLVGKRSLSLTNKRC